MVKAGAMQPIIGLLWWVQGRNYQVRFSAIHGQVLVSLVICCLLTTTKHNEHCSVVARATSYGYILWRGIDCVLLCWRNPIWGRYGISMGIGHNSGWAPWPLSCGQCQPNAFFLRMGGRELSLNPVKYELLTHAFLSQPFNAIQLCFQWKYL